MAASADSTVDVIANDRPCANCGYNLRTLAVAGRCPECGESVANSFVPGGFRFRSPMTPRRVRNGLVVVIVAILLGTVLNLMHMGMIYVAWLIQEGPVSVLTRIAAPATRHALTAVPMLMLIGVVLATWPFGRRGDRFLWPLGVGVAVLGAGYSLYTIGIRVVPWSSGAPSAYWAGVRALVGPVALASAFALAMTLAWVHLLTRVRFGRNRRLWLAMFAVVLIQLMLLASSASSLVTMIARTKYVTVSGGTLTYLGPALKTITIRSQLDLSAHRISAIVSIITVVALWLYLRGLRGAARADRPEAGPPIGTGN